MIIKLQRVLNSRITFVAVTCAGLIVLALVALSLRASLKNSYHLEGLAEFDRAYLLLSERVNTYVFGLQGLGGVYLISNFNQPNNRFASKRVRASHLFFGVRGFGFLRAYPAEIKPTKNHAGLYPSVQVQILGEKQPEIFWS